MANLQKIKILAREKNISLDALANNLGITPQALSKAIRLNSTKIETLERIAEQLGVSPCEFFSDASGATGQVVATEGSIAVSGKQIKLIDQQARQFLANLSKKDEHIDRLLGQIDRLHAIIEHLTDK